MLSIVRVGILETIASITCWEGPGVVRRDDDEKRNQREERRKG